MGERRYIAVEGHAKTAEEAIALAAKALRDAGYVDESFSQDCIDREREYPTGLCTDIPVAIPHCQSDHILETGVCYLRLHHPVEFRRMDDDTKVIFTRNIFNLAVKGGENHIAFLQKVIGMVTTESVMTELEGHGIEDVPHILEKYL